MCGRFTLRTPAETIVKVFAVALPSQLPLRFNIAPTQLVLAIRRAGTKREAAWLSWGFVPSWSKDQKIAFKTINARAETLAKKPMFRQAFRRQRCLIVADGFYEWRKVNPKIKEPVWFTLRDESPFAFAGLWDRWTAPDGSVLESCTIITTSANALIAPLHDRMPVILTPAAFEEWLDPAVDDPHRLMPRLAPFPADEMKSEPVSSIINNARNEVDPRLPRT
jgi:putative SOS response-associated peptidase YedK